MQIDPGLKELLFRRTGGLSFAELGGAAAAELVPVLARLRDPDRPVDDLTVTGRFGSVVSGRVPLGAILEVRADPNIASLKASRELRGDLALTVPEIGAGGPSLGPDGPR